MFNTKYYIECRGNTQIFLTSFTFLHKIREKVLKLASIRYLGPSTFVLKENYIDSDKKKIYKKFTKG